MLSTNPNMGLQMCMSDPTMFPVLEAALGIKMSTPESFKSDLGKGGSSGGGSAMEEEDDDDDEEVPNLRANRAPNLPSSHHSSILFFFPFVGARG